MKSLPKIYYIYLGLVIIYAALAFLIPPSAATLHKYHISSFQLRLLDITVVIPYVLIWLAGFYGFDKLKRYSTRIKRSKDGRQVNKLANGIFLLVLWPPLSTILGTLADAISTHHAGTKGVGVVVNEYFNLIWPLGGFLLISSAAWGLNEIAKLQISKRALHIMALLLIGLGLLYDWLVSYAFRHGSSTFHMPHWLFVVTLVMPYIYMWFLGFLATYQIYLYQRKVAGIVYRHSWRLLALAVGAIIVMQMIVEYANTLVTALSKLTLGWYVLVLYMVLILLAVGYILVARGAQKLQKIEEV